MYNASLYLNYKRKLHKKKKYKFCKATFWNKNGKRKTNYKDVALQTRPASNWLKQQIILLQRVQDTRYLGPKHHKREK